MPSTRDPKTLPLLLASLPAIAVASLLAGCAISSFPVEDTPALREKRSVKEIVVYFDDSEPSCPFRDVAVLSYDWARDGIMTSQDIALKGLRRRAAKMGASGIRAVEMIPGANVSMALVNGQATASSNSVSASAVGYGVKVKEFGARGVAYYCM